MYTGIQNLYDQPPSVAFISVLKLGDMLIKPGSSGQVIIIVASAENSSGARLFVFAQGITPAQRVHLLKKPNDTFASPWDTLAFNPYLETSIYYLNDRQCLRFK